MSTQRSLLGKALCEAVESDDLARVTSLLDQGAPMEPLHALGDSPLHLAVSRQNQAMVALLIERGHPINVPGKYHRTPLYLASLEHSEAICAQLLAAGASVRIEAWGNQKPLHAAAIVGAAGICRRLIEKGADVDVPDDRGQTPLVDIALKSVAGAAHHIDAARVLLENGALVDAKSYDGLTPLQIAVKTSNPDLCKLLVERGADVFRPLPKETQVIGMPTAPWLATSLHLAATKDSVEVARILVQAGVSPSFMPDQPNAKYLTPFQLAVAVGNDRLVSYFVEECEERVDQVTTDGLTMEGIATPKMVEHLRSLRAATGIIDALSTSNVAPSQKKSLSMGPL